ncbi:uncharacterized protein [Rutidosis leptorrhynchoides]|uniref:uncharacterized protein isoform X2 n=1 Tax=Rutidosis leptorrhynchoides TaxID=125765 RepID=UPI003A99A9C1
MEIQSTETTEHSTVVSVTHTETTESPDQSTVPVRAVDNPQTAETLQQSPPPMQTAAAAPLNTEATENLEDVTVEAEPSEESKVDVDAKKETGESVEQSTVSSFADTKTTATMEQSITNNSHDNLIASDNHLMEMRHETVEEEEEIKSVLKEIAVTGKFCRYDWERLKSMLSLHLKQVISEYPQAKMTPEEQKNTLGETHADLVKRLDDALLSFVDGPPFTLQRICEIILDARSLYPNLSKFAFALEKNLSVTSTLTMSTIPDPPLPITTTTTNGLEHVTNDPDPNLSSERHSDTVMENGAILVAGDRDEIMTDAEADVSDVMTMDVETNEKSLESSPITTGDS